MSQPCCNDNSLVGFSSLTAGNAMYLNASKEIYDVEDKVRAAIYKKDPVLA